MATKLRALAVGLAVLLLLPHASRGGTTNEFDGTILTGGGQKGCELNLGCLPWVEISGCGSSDPSVSSRNLFGGVHQVGALTALESPTIEFRVVPVRRDLNSFVNAVVHTRDANCEPTGANDGIITLHTPISSTVRFRIPQGTEWLIVYVTDHPGKFLKIDYHIHFL